jgi:DNA mismatch repair protein MutS
VSKNKQETPLMRQYNKIKERHPDAVLLFRLGDFYETFEEDARTVARILGITLTKRSNGQAADVPLAGFPYHALDTYLPRLVQAGLRVAICEQLEDPKLARKVVKRDVVEVVTPGVSLHDQILNPRRSNYLAAVHFGDRADGRVGVSFADVSTGEFQVTEVDESGLEAMLQTIGPAELLVDKRKKSRVESFRERPFVPTYLEDWVFGYDFGYETLLRHFKTHSLKGFGVDHLQTGIIAAGAVLYYLGETQKGRLPQFRRLTAYSGDDYIALDAATRRNLELVSNMHSGGQEGSLFQILDETLTPMGARLLRRWLVRPLRKLDVIERRLDAVEALFSGTELRDRVREELRQVSDLERLAAKVATGRATPRDLVFLKLSLRQVPRVKATIEGHPCHALAEIAASLSLCAGTVERIDRALVEEPPAQLGLGGAIRPGYNAELDELRTLARSGKDWIARMQKHEVERTGIPSLKVGFNKVFGYYIEITNAHKGKVPEDYVRKQTLVNAERYITPALKEYEEKILSAEEKMAALEGELFNELRMTVAEDVAPMQTNAQMLARLDVLASLAEVAVRHGYARPTLDESLDLDIEDGRHPVVEHSLAIGESFIPNSVRLSTADQQILIITGPNMAGKSVILRQVGLIVLLAQVGSFVPARRAHVGIVDRIFTRVGASDNLAAGESTFLVEMNETANILNNASERSLILLDEVGRGTSTFDGLSIAWSLVEYLHEVPSIAARTLFATHYHELNELADRYPRVRNARIEVHEQAGKVIFLRRLLPGGADHSYGIEVARMAGLPESVILRAKEILAHLESQHLAIDGQGGGHNKTNGAPVHAKKPVTRNAPAPETTFQMSLFTADPRLVDLMERVRSLDVDRLTPVEALLKLAEFKRIASE